VVTSPTKFLLSQREAADALAISESTVANLRRAGKLPFVKFGKSVRFRVEDVRAIAARLPVQTASR
jgi:excisionase family DNA binding protein